MAKLLKGDIVCQTIKDDIKKEIEKIGLKDKKPTLSFVCIGDDAGTKSYIKSKKKDCDYCGVNLEDYMLNDSTTTKELLDVIHSLNDNTDINGIIVGLPLPQHINSSEVLSSISPLKDVDSLSDISLGKLIAGTQLFSPCTPCGIIEILKYYNISIEGKRCVVVGRSNIVGKPLSMLLLNNNGTVTVCHSKTQNLSDITKTADILVSAIGRPNTITKDMVKDNAIVIDVGTNRVDNKLVGDVDFDNVQKIASAITPVPGGVGLMTRTMLIKNTLIAFKKQHNI